MALMREYENYKEWQAARESVRNSLHLFDEEGKEIPDELVDDKLVSVTAIRADDDDAVEFLAGYHSNFDLFERKYSGVRGGEHYIQVGDTYAYCARYGWMNLTEMVKEFIPTVSKLAEVYAA